MAARRGGGLWCGVRRQGPQLLVEVLLVPLHGEGVVCLLRLDEEAGVVALGVRGIAGHGDSLQVVGVQEGGEACGLVRLLGDPELGDGHPGAGHRGEQVRGRGGAEARAAAALTVQGDGVGAGRVVAEEIGQAAGAGVLDDPADRRAAGRDAHGQGGCGAGTEPGQDVLRGLGRPLADLHETSRPGHHGGAGDQQYCHEGVTLPAPAPRIGQCPQPLGQRADRTVLTGGRLDQADGGRLTAHRSSVAGRRLGKVTSTTELRCVRSRACGRSGCDAGTACVRQGVFGRGSSARLPRAVPADSVCDIAARSRSFSSLSLSLSG